jgi:hypothetical protein
MKQKCEKCDGNATKCDGNAKKCDGNAKKCDGNATEMRQRRALQVSVGLRPPSTYSPLPNMLPFHYNWYKKWGVLNGGRLGRGKARENTGKSPARCG